MSADRLRVVHLDHSTAPGGAELALLRMLATGPAWDASVMLPTGVDDGVFDGLGGDVGVVRAGPTQRAGLGARSGALRVRETVGGAVDLVGAALAVRRVARGADVVHANTSRAAVYGALAVRRRQHLVVHLRDLVTRAALGGYGFLALRLALRRCDAVVANSAATLASAVPFLPAGTPTLVLPSPLGLDGVRPRGTLDVGDGAPRVVGMVARLAHWKGQELLVEAFAKAYGGTSTRLRLVGAAQFGDDDVVTRVRARAAELGVADQLDLTGHVVDVAREIARMDVCVQASTLPEPLGQNVLQYLALGRPTVVADAGGPIEWVRDGVNGLVFRTGDPGSLAAALARLAEPAMRARLAAAAVTTAVPTDAEVSRAFASFLHTLSARTPSARIPAA